MLLNVFFFWLKKKNVIDDIDVIVCKVIFLKFKLIEIRVMIYFYRF